MTTEQNWTEPPVNRHLGFEVNPNYLFRHDLKTNRRFRPVPIVLNNDNRRELDGSDWILKLPLMYLFCKVVLMIKFFLLSRGVQHFQAFDFNWNFSISLNVVVYCVYQPMHVVNLEIYM